MNRHVITGIVILGIVLILVVIFIPLATKQNADQEMEGKQSEPVPGERVIASFGLDGKNPDRTIFLNNPDLTERFLNASEADIGTYYYPKGPVIGFGKDKGGSIVVMIDDSQKVNLTIASEIHDRISVRGRTFGITNVPCKFVLAGIVEVGVPKDTMP